MSYPAEILFFLDRVFFFGTSTEPTSISSEKKRRKTLIIKSECKYCQNSLFVLMNNNNTQISIHNNLLGGVM